MSELAAKNGGLESSLAEPVTNNNIAIDFVASNPKADRSQSTIHLSDNESKLQYLIIVTCFWLIISLMAVVACLYISLAFFTFAAWSKEILLSNKIHCDCSKNLQASLKLALVNEAGIPQEFDNKHGIHCIKYIHSNKSLKVSNLQKHLLLDITQTSILIFCNK